jgi:nitrogen fixation protein NifU and related proteins
MFDDVRDLYQDIILRHSRQPLHMRRLENFDAKAVGDNPMCGDRCEVRLRLEPEGTVADIGYEARGCAISLASADLMAETAAGLNKAQLRALAEDFFALVRTGTTESDDPALEQLKPLSGVAEYPSRIKCATLPWTAALAALDGVQEATSE